jgi:hypothetical protein
MPEVNYFQIFLTAMFSGIFAFIAVFINNRITESKKTNIETEDKVNKLKENVILNAISESENRQLLAIQKVETGLKAEIGNSERRLGDKITNLSERISRLERINEAKV